MSKKIPKPKPIHTTQATGYPRPPGPRTHPSQQCTLSLRCAKMSCQARTISIRKMMGGDHNHTQPRFQRKTPQPIDRLPPCLQHVRSPSNHNHNHPQPAPYDTIKPVPYDGLPLPSFSRVAESERQDTQIFTSFLNPPPKPC